MDANDVLPRERGKSPWVPGLQTCDPRGADEGVWRRQEGGAELGRLSLQLPHPHILPTLLQLPPHPARGAATHRGQRAGGVGWGVWALAEDPSLVALSYPLQCQGGAFALWSGPGPSRHPGTEPAASRALLSKGLDTSASLPARLPACLAPHPPLTRSGA